MRIRVTGILILHGKNANSGIIMVTFYPFIQEKLLEPNIIKIGKTPTFIGDVHRNGGNVLGFSGEQLDALNKRNSTVM